jgi:hypothetical protein
MKTVACIVAFVVLFSAVLLPAHAEVLTTETSVMDKTDRFLSEVVGLDLTKYNVTRWEINTTLPDYYPFNITRYFREQAVAYHLDSEVSNITLDCYFKKGQITYCMLYVVDGLPIYSQTESRDIKQTTESMLQNYQLFVTQNYGIENSYIIQAQNMFSHIPEVEALTQVNNNVKLDISYNDMNRTRIQWIYTENGTDVPKKRLELQLDKNGDLFFFLDNWSLYTVGTLETISEEEFVNLALEAINNTMLTFILDENGTTVEIKPDMTNATYDAWLGILPRHSDKLYPYWQAFFYFEKPVYSTVGMQVGIWGDTCEIEYCSGLSILGPPGYGRPNNSTTDNENSGTQQEPQQELQEEQQEEKENTEPQPDNSLLVGLAGVLSAFVVIAALVIWKHRKDNTGQALNIAESQT